MRIPTFARSTIRSAGRIFSTAAGLLLAIGSAVAAEPAAAPASPAPAATGKTGPVVLLKLDDLRWHGNGPKATVTPRWQKVTDFLEGMGLKASYGIICESLADDDHPGYIAWLKERESKGLIELWNHGYIAAFKADNAAGKTAQFVGTTLDEQRASIAKGQDLFRAKLGHDMHAFGPHASGVDTTTYQVLNELPAITMVWYYGPPTGVTSDKFVFERRLNLEVPTFVPNPDDVRTRFEKYGRSLPYIAMQGHPNQWDDQRYADFTTIVKYLVDQGCTFTTPSEYLAAHPAAQQKTPTP